MIKLSKYVFHYITLLYCITYAFFQELLFKGFLCCITLHLFTLFTYIPVYAGINLPGSHGNQATQILDKCNLMHLIEYHFTEERL